jgi:hypothetical protein
MRAGKQPHRERLRAVAITAGVLPFLGVSDAVFPRHPDLRTFDPAAMARSETLMWRHYYDHRYLSAFADLYDGSRTQSGFSPWERKITAADVVAQNAQAAAV